MLSAGRSTIITSGSWTIITSSLTREAWYGSVTGVVRKLGALWIRWKWLYWWLSSSLAKSLSYFWGSITFKLISSKRSIETPSSKPFTIWSWQYLSRFAQLKRSQSYVFPFWWTSNFLSRLCFFWAEKLINTLSKSTFGIRRWGDKYWSDSSNFDTVSYDHSSVNFAKGLM